MPPIVATLVFCVMIAGLFWLDRDNDVKTSLALWIPVIWVAIVCSRPVSAWLGGSSPATADQVLDGSPVDRLLYTLLLCAGVLVLILRIGPIGRILRANGPIILFLAFCLFSLLWSDFPGIAFKRWAKELGDLSMVLIVVTDREPLVAIRRFLARLSYILIPMSILLIKYYPSLGMGYNEWTGGGVYTGVTTNKNTLGAICLCFGLGALWRLIATYQDRELAGRKRKLLANGILLAMVIRLFIQMNSMTSLGCFLMAGVLMLAANMKLTRRWPVIIHALMISMVLVSFSVLFLGVSPESLQAMGRNPTLTERTELWGQLLSLVHNPVIGTGFESFWLGPRLDWLWRVNPWKPNEAHDGYLEVYLNLGWVGIGLLAFVILAGYRTVFRGWRKGIPTGSLSLTYFFVGLVYNFTEAAFFKISAAAWIFFLFAIVSVPAVLSREAEPVADELVQPVGRANYEPTLITQRQPSI